MIKNSNIQVGLAQMKGNKIVEVNSEGYKRRKTWFCHWFTQENGLTWNLLPIRLGYGAKDWGIITHILFFRNNELIGKMQMEEAKRVNDWNSVSFPIGTLVTDLL